MSERPEARRVKNETRLVGTSARDAGSSVNSREKAMNRLAGMIVGAGCGYTVGFLGGTVWYCVLTPDPSNLCGLIGIFYTGPICLVIGVVAGFFASRPKDRGPGSGGG